MKYLERYNINHHFTSALNASNYYLPGIQNKYSARPINKHHPNLLPRIPTLPQTPPLCVTKSSKLLFIAICSFTQNSKMLLLMVCEEMGDPPVATTVVVFFFISRYYFLWNCGEKEPLQRKAKTMGFSYHKVWKKSCKWALLSAKLFACYSSLRLRV